MPRGPEPGENGTSEGFAEAGLTCLLVVPTFLLDVPAEIGRGYIERADEEADSLSCEHRCSVLSAVITPRTGDS